MRALVPLFFFVAVYLVLSIVVGDFYKVPITVAFMLTAIVAVATSRGRLPKRLKVFSRGAGEGNVMLMIWIFILAGAFAESAGQMGSITDVVNLIFSLVPSNALMAGLFLSSALISLSIGTSVGTIVALAPLAAGMGSGLGVPAYELTAIVVGGSFFGDNLSFISDTTVVATQSQGVRMSDKFRTNVRIALPAAIAVLVLYIVIGADLHTPNDIQDINYLKVVPYFVVLVTAACGLNVLLVLSIGLLLTGVIGIVCGDYDLFSWFSAMGNGIMNMGSLIIITMLAGGILEVIRVNGGIRYVMRSVMAHVRSQRTAELSIAALVSIVDMCTANNTVAIITVSGIARDISQRFALDARRVASILDTFSCIMQGIIPYGAQMLMAAGIAHCSPLDILPYVYYPYALGIFAIGNIIFIRRNKCHTTAQHA